MLRVYSILILAIWAIPVSAESFVCKIRGETEILARGKTYTVPAEWTGVAISEDLILSVAHPMESGVAEAEFDGKVVRFDVIKSDKSRDLALYRCREPHGVRPVILADRHPITARIIGFTQTGKKVLNYRVSPNTEQARIIEGEPFLVMYGEAFQGMSGSPVLTEDGKLAGIQAAGDPDLKTTSAASLNQLKAFLKDFEEELPSAKLAQ